MDGLVELDYHEVLFHGTGARNNFVFGLFDVQTIEKMSHKYH